MSDSFLIVELAGEEWAIPGEAVESVAAEEFADGERIDLRERFDLPPTDGRRCVVVVRVANERRVGLVVDVVRDLVELPEVEPPPDLGESIVPAWLGGLVRYDDRFALVLEAGELAPCSS